MPTKKPVAPINFAENDKKVFEWYNSRSAGEKYTMEEAAAEIGITVNELDNSLSRLLTRVLRAPLGHIVDEPAKYQRLSER